MNTHIQAEAHLEKETQVQAALSEIDLLARYGFSLEEIVALLGCGSGTRQVAVIAFRSCAAWSSSSGCS